MPGGRLTHEDRRRIAAGLAAGLGYAEIARRLGRPTSTVTREVARNGGPNGYRADQATRATLRRARRRKTSPVPATVPETDAYGRDPGALRDFENQFAAMVVQTGIPRMAGRVLAGLFVTDTGTLTVADLVQRLRVSPASISKAIAYLEGQGLVRRERDSRRRYERYVVDGGTWLRAWSASVRANELWGDAARRGVAVLGAATPAGARMDFVRQFFENLQRDMTTGASTAVAVAAGDAMTVLAALVDFGEALSAEALGAALGWSRDRVAKALRDATEHPEITDPVALRLTESGAYTVAAKPDRLTVDQREALRKLRKGCER